MRSRSGGSPALLPRVVVALSRYQSPAVPVYVSLVVKTGVTQNSATECKRYFSQPLPVLRKLATEVMINSDLEGQRSQHYPMPSLPLVSGKTIAAAIEDLHVN